MKVISVEYIGKNHRKTIEPLKFEKITIKIAAEDHTVFAVVMENAIISRAVPPDAIYRADKFDWLIRALTKAEYVEFNDWKRSKLFGIRFTFDSYFVIFNATKMLFIDLDGEVTKC